MILGILMLLVFPSILNSIKKTKGNLTEAGKELLFSSTALYLDSKQNEYPLEEDGHYCITVQELLDSKKLESINLIPNLKETDKVEVNVENNQYTYTLNNECKIRYLKEVIENDTSHIVKNTKVNGEIVNKVIGSKSEKYTMTNYVWYAGQLWQVLETNDTNHTIKLITAHSLTSIAYGSTTDWNTSWVRKWLNDVFLGSIEGTELITNTNFCLDTVNTTSTTIQDVDSGYTRNILNVSSHTPIQACTNQVTEKVGLMSFEDYVYANSGNNPVYTGNSFLDEDEFTWTITSYDDNRMWIQWFKDPAFITAQTDSNVFSVIKNFGHGIRPILSIKDTVIIKSGMGTKSNPYILVGEKSATKGNNIASVKVGEYVYLDESNNPYSFTEDTIANGVKYKTTKDKVRYRVVKKNNDGSVKVERADILRNLSSTVAARSGMYVPFYYKASSDGCYYNESENKWYTSGCNGHNYFQVTGNTNEYAYTNSINIGDYLNSSSNSFYSWYSDTTKAMIKKETYHRYTSGQGKDYANLNDNPTGTYPTITNDGDITTYVFLPTWGEMYSGNDLNITYWYGNRQPGSSFVVSNVTSVGHGNVSTAGYHLLAIRPVVTLKPNVKISGGKGTMTEPYSLNL